MHRAALVAQRCKWGSHAKHRAFSVPPEVSKSPPGEVTNQSALAIGAVAAALALAGTAYYYTFRGQDSPVPAKNVRAVVEKKVEEKSLHRLSSDTAKLQQKAKVDAVSPSQARPLTDQSEIIAAKAVLSEYNAVIDLAEIRKVLLENDSLKATAIKPPPLTLAPPVPSVPTPLLEASPPPSPVPAYEKDYEELIHKVQALKDSASMAASGSVKAVLESQVHASLSRSLDRLGKAELLAYLGTMVTDLKDRTTLEAVRLHETLARQESAMHQRGVDLLSEQAHKYDQLIRQELKRDGDSTHAASSAAQRRALDISRERLREAKRYHDFNVAALAEGVTLARQLEATETANAAIGREERRLSAQLQSETAASGAALAKLDGTANVLTSRVDVVAAAEKRSRQSQMFCIGLQALSNAVDSSQSFAKELDALRAASRGDDLVQTVLNSLPSGVTNGVQSHGQLRTRFQRVAVAARNAAKVPEDSGFAGMILGRLTSAVLLHAGEGEGDAVDKILFEADKALAGGDLRAAFFKLATLTGAPSDTCKDLLDLMRQRLAVEQAIRVIKTHAILLTAA